MLLNEPLQIFRLHPDGRRIVIRVHADQASKLCIQIENNPAVFIVQKPQRSYRPGFQAKQFFVCLIATILYLVCIYYFGFYISTVVFMVAVLLFLKVPPLYTAITVVVIVALIYFAFQKFLGVKLPVGTVIKALRK